MTEYRTLYAYRQFLAARAAGKLQTEAWHLDTLAAQVLRNGQAADHHEARALVMNAEFENPRGAVRPAEVEVSADGRYSVLVSGGQRADVFPQGQSWWASSSAAGNVELPAGSSKADALRAARGLLAVTR